MHTFDPFRSSHACVRTLDDPRITVTLHHLDPQRSLTLVDRVLLILLEVLRSYLLGLELFDLEMLNTPHGFWFNCLFDDKWWKVAFVLKLSDWLVLVMQSVYECLLWSIERLSSSFVLPLKIKLKCELLSIYTKIRLKPNFFKYSFSDSKISFLESFNFRGKCLRLFNWRSNDKLFIFSFWREETGFLSWIIERISTVLLVFGNIDFCRVAKSWKIDVRILLQMFWEIVIVKIWFIYVRDEWRRNLFEF